MTGFSFLASTCLSLGMLIRYAIAGDGVAVYVPAKCSGTLDSSVHLSDLSDKTQGPPLMRDMFCETFTSKPSSASYDLCGSSEQVDCTREDKQAGYDLKGTMHRQVSDNNRAECLQAYGYIIDNCLAKGASTGTVEFGNGGYKYEMTVSASSGTTPAQKVTCSGDANPQPQPFPNDLLWYMRQSYCSAGGCSDQGDECEVYVHGNGYRMKLTGSIPKDQSDTQFSQVCYDTTEAIINECWLKGKKGGYANLVNGESYGYYLVDGNEPPFVEVPIGS